MVEKEKENNNLFSKKYVILIILIIILLTIITGIKSYYLITYQYTNEPYDIENSKKINEARNLKVNTIILPEEECYEFAGIKVRNDFKNFELVKEDINKDSAIRYLKKDSEIIMIGYSKSRIDVLTHEMYKGDDKKVKELNKFLSRNKIYNDVDLFKYLGNINVKKSNLFTSINKIKDNYFKSQLMVTVPNSRKFVFLSGSKLGYVIDDELRTEINIIENNQIYFVSFQNHNLTDAYFENFINTINITKKVNH